MLQDSHRKLADAADTMVAHLLIPLRAMLIMDRILATLIAPRLGLEYTPMDEKMFSNRQNPELKWDGKTIFVSLPEKRGRVMEAKWNPTITSVIRIREVRTEEWSIGFETPFNMCSFVGLKPDTEYEVQLTHKNTEGEGAPAYTSIRTKRDEK